MNIIIGMQHPKHFWIFRRTIEIGTSKGWNFKIIASGKDVLLELLDSTDFDYVVAQENRGTLIGKIWVTISLTLFTLFLSKNFKPDFYLGQAFPYFTFASLLRKTPYLIYEDTEPVGPLHSLTVPGCSFIITPRCFKKDFGDKQIRLDTYLELSYLHPEIFQADRNRLLKYNIDSESKFALLRFISWTAHHDFGKKGLSMRAKKTIISILEKSGYNIFITSEIPLKSELEKYSLKVHPKDIHHIMAFSDIYFGESGTMTTESCILGIPSIMINSFASQNQIGNFIELEKDYDLIVNSDSIESSISSLYKIIKDSKSLDKWNKKSKQMIKDKINLTNFNIDFLENYPKIPNSYTKNVE